ncbi:hypothetical protein HW115_13185 [Verrucomicrobiaceae bacterium N1E253]|uniref:Uncharacterized protein n=1 Tax=Oceaniferula marina TaxID=2748318 RepID=A0A851GH94_9BACT|nr:hypothetical protein [Oceaniferula marina]NWK56569.1 hypothetical protein [Oceaniferula marina]
MNTFTLSGILAALFCCGVALAQEAAPEVPSEKKPKEGLEQPKLGLIALGPKPIRRYRMPNEKDKEKIRAKMAEMEKSVDPTAGGPKGGGPGGQAIMLDVPEFAAPPSQAYYRKTIEGEKKWTSLAIGFNNQVGLSKVPAMKEFSLYRKLDGQSGGDALVRMPALKPNTQTLVFLTPQGKGSNRWRSSPKLTAVPLNWSEQGDTRLLLVNTSDQSVRMQVGKQKPFTMAAHTKKSLNLPKGKRGQRVVFFAKGAKDKKIAIQDSIRPVPGLIKVYAFYSAQPKTNGGRTLGVYRGGYDRPDDKSS